jgi:hypothetical protein
MKHQRPTVSVSFLGLQEVDRLFAPVSQGVEVVRGVVAVVEAEAVGLVVNVKSTNFIGVGKGERTRTYRHINQSNTTPKIGIRIHLVHQRMLAPVPDHQPQPQLHKRNEEHECRSPGVYVRGHVVQEGVAGQFGGESPEGEAGFVLAQEVERELGPDEEEEA